MAHQTTEPWMDEGCETFRTVHDAGSPEHVSRAPGRVNLIGEHTDYNGLPVFPMALRQEVRVFFRARPDGQVRFANPEAEFPARCFTLARDIPKEPTGDWGNYLKAACQALVRRLGALNGMDALVTSTVPVASGLSSSSALVIAVGRALLRANRKEIPTLDLAEEMARAERYTGTRGGGMDQAISLGAREGHASRIEFEPLRMIHSPVPAGWRFVVAHTLVRAEKSGSAQAAYNRRRKECEDALSTVARALSTEGTRYRDLLAHHSPDELLDIGRAALPDELFPRFRHVVTEGARVYAAEEAMRAGDLGHFGSLMNESHESLREDYEVSSPELDRLVELARRGGAAGARLTGAGFGGCIVALVEAGSLDPVLSALRRYYDERGVDECLSEALFQAEAGPGARVLTLD